MTRLPFLFIGILFAALFGVAAPLKAQAKEKMVRLSVGLTEREGKAVIAFSPHDIQVYEDGEPQKVLVAAHEEGPVSIGILLDVSSSQKKHLLAVLEAVRSFIESSNSEDEFFIATFGDEVRLRSDFADRRAALDKLLAPAFENRSKVYDAIHYGLQKIRHGKFARRALLLITDGQEDGSQISYGRLCQAIKEADTQIYCLGVGNTNSDEGEGPGNYQLGHLLLEEIARLTGGTVYRKDKPEQLRQEAQLIAQQLWHQYSLVYQRPSTTGEEKWHKIKVQVASAKITVRAKQGYFSP